MAIGLLFSIYSIIPGEFYVNDTVNRTFAPINKIKMSPDNKKIVVAHSKGTSIIDGYVINDFDNSMDFVTNGVSTGQVPTDFNWRLLQNIGNSRGAYNDNSGFNINTLYNNS